MAIVIRNLITFEQIDEILGAALFVVCKTTFARLRSSCSSIDAKMSMDIPLYASSSLGIDSFYVR